MFTLFEERGIVVEVVRCAALIVLESRFRPVWLIVACPYHICLLLLKHLYVCLYIHYKDA